MKLFSFLVAGVAGVAALKVCDPCKQQCMVPCRAVPPSQLPKAHLPVVWEDDKPASEVKAPYYSLNPYNSVRPEYEDAPPSKVQLEKMWQHHLKDHEYKTPFVRPMKSGLWEAGVPNRFAAGGFNRRKFPTEQEALDFVRHKTGAGSDLDYDKTEFKQKKEPVVDEEEEPPKAEEEVTKIEAKKPKPESAPALVELKNKISAPTTDIDRNEAEAMDHYTSATDRDMDDSEAHTQAIRDYDLQVAHKMRDFLANYRPDHEVKVVSAGFDA